jgi:hypothetical protein
MWDENDTSSRWIQGLCAIPLIAFIAFDAFLLLNTDPTPRVSSAEGVALLGALYLLYRVLWYALTGKGNVNRDDY